MVEEITWGDSQEAIALLQSWANEPIDEADETSWEELRLALLETDPDIGL